MLAKWCTVGWDRVGKSWWCSVPGPCAGCHGRRTGRPWTILWQDQGILWKRKSEKTQSSSFNDEKLTFGMRAWQKPKHLLNRRLACTGLDHRGWLYEQYATYAAKEDQPTQHILRRAGSSRLLVSPFTPLLNCVSFEQPPKTGGYDLFAKCMWRGLFATRTYGPYQADHLRAQLVLSLVAFRVVIPSCSSILARVIAASALSLSITLWIILLLVLALSSLKAYS